MIDPPIINRSTSNRLEVYANADSAFRPAVEAVELITDGLLRAQELRVANLTTGGSALWANSFAPAIQWSSDSSDPYTDFDNAIANVVNTTGVMPNTAVMSYDVWRALRKHPDFLERIKYTRNDGVVNLNDMKQWFNIDKWLIGTALYDTAREGQTSSMAQIWGDGVWIGYVPANAALLTPAAGYTFEWAGRQIRTFRMDQERTDVFEVSHNLVEKICASDVGTVLANVI